MLVKTLKKFYALIFFYTLDIKNISFNPKFYQHFLPSLVITDNWVISDKSYKLWPDDPQLHNAENLNYRKNNLRKFYMISLHIYEYAIPLVETKLILHFEIKQNLDTHTG